MNTNTTSRSRGLAAGVAVLGVLLSVGGATAAHAESNWWDEPSQTYTDGETSGLGSGGGGGGGWVADQYRYDMTNLIGYDFYARIDGGVPSATDAAVFQQNYNYSGGCIVPWWTDHLMCSD